MIDNIFIELKKYASDKQSQDENYATQSLAVLMAEFPNFKQYLLFQLFDLEVEHTATVNTQVRYQTNDGVAIPDLVIEDTHHRLLIEVKIESPLNLYAPNEEYQEGYNQIAKYESCQGLNPEKARVCLLSKYPIEPPEFPYRFFDPSRDKKRWRDLYGKTQRYVRRLNDGSPEYYLLSKFLLFMKEENMAGFTGFGVEHLLALPGIERAEEACEELAAEVLDHIEVEGFQPKVEYDYGRYEALYEFRGDKTIKIFLGVWLSDDDYEVKFQKEAGPQVMTFFEMPPNHRLREEVISSPAYASARRHFQECGSRSYQLLIGHRPIANFLGEADQGEALLDYFRNQVSVLSNSGLLEYVHSLYS